MNIAMILAGGKGKRVTSLIPKQFIKVKGKTILQWTIEKFINNENIDMIEVVCLKDYVEEIQNICSSIPTDKKFDFCIGGDTFQKSTINGINKLKNIAKDDDIVVVSFGVSPLTLDGDINSAIEVAKIHGNGIASVDIDLCTCIKKDEYKSKESILRENIKGFANPWAFKFKEIVDVYDEATKKNIIDTVEPHITSLYFALNKDIYFSKCTSIQPKITYDKDIEFFRIYQYYKEPNAHINYKEFEVIKEMLKFKDNDNEISKKIFDNIDFDEFKNENEVKDILQTLTKNGYIENNKVTSIALKEIENRKVDNAIILAAGISEITSKSAFGNPKGLYIKNNETLIDRSIRQLVEAGIKDIVVVIGYKQEMYFYLQKKWKDINIKLIVNTDLKKNNIYSLYVARNELKNSYILNCDNYYENNPFSQYEYKSFFTTIDKDSIENELAIRKNNSNKLLSIYSGKEQGEVVDGFAFLTKKDSEKLIEFLEKEIDDIRVSRLFWQEFVNYHKDDIDIYIKKYKNNNLEEFDTIKEIQNANGMFLGNVSDIVNKKICDVFNVKTADIKNINIIQKGLTNILFTFEVFDKKYIFRFPGASSNFFIYRANEVIAQKIAYKSHTDNTYVYIDETGVKISKYIEDTVDIHNKYYYDIDFMKKLAKKISTFHNEGYKYVEKLTKEEITKYMYDPVYEAEKLFKEASKIKDDLFKLFESEWKKIIKLKQYLDKDNFKKTICHNDINIDNVLFSESGEIDIIDYEFAGLNDPGYDFGRVIAGLPYSATDNRIKEILNAYFGRETTEKELLHFIGYACLHNWYYLGWALYKESINESSRDWMLYFYNQSIKLLNYILPKYDKVALGGG